MIAFISRGYLYLFFWESGINIAVQLYRFHQKAMDVSFVSDQ
jgi:hypothetical protein